MRVNLSVSPKGIEVLDTVSGETLHGISINRISYCSADGAYSKVFAFVASGSGGDNGSGSGSDCDRALDNVDVDDLTCYAFLCGKRKMAHNLTITVAKNFERAFNLWKKFEQTKATAYRGNDDTAKHCAQYDSNDARRPSDKGRDNVLIDFDSDGMQATQRRLLQTAWVSFDDDSATDDNHQPPQMIEWQRNLVF